MYSGERSSDRCVAVLKSRERSADRYVIFLSCLLASGPSTAAWYFSSDVRPFCGKCVDLAFARSEGVPRALLWTERSRNRYM